MITLWTKLILLYAVVTTAPPSILHTFFTNWSLFKNFRTKFFGNFFPRSKASSPSNLLIKQNWKTEYGQWASSHSVGTLYLGFWKSRRSHYLVRSLVRRCDWQRHRPVCVKKWSTITSKKSMFPTFCVEVI